MTLQFGSTKANTIRANDLKRATLRDSMQDAEEELERLREIWEEAQDELSYWRDQESDTRAAHDIYKRKMYEAGL